MAENLTKLCSSVGWSAKFVSDELGYLAEETYKLSVKGVGWFLLAAYSKMSEERDKLRRICEVEMK